ncbi:hypothetical protein GB937_006969 [Aspergillus fischeri]|nr:hypothetical protein GB937_006969 [Aspergillus fischeri]
MSRRYHKLSIRKVQGSPDKVIIETMRDGILNQSEDSAYVALFIVAAPVDYDCHVTCENFATIRCLIQVNMRQGARQYPGTGFLIRNRLEL